MNPPCSNHFVRLPRGKRSPSLSGRIGGALIFLVFLFGCATVPPLPREEAGEKPREEPREEVSPSPLPPVEERVAPEDPFRAFPEKYRAQALEWERKENWPKALFFWQVVKSLRPDDPESAEKKKNLQERIGSQSEKHFLKGLEEFRKNALPAARREFLLALTCNPDHAQALEYLKNKLNETDLLIYETREGDTLRKIAAAVYQDPNKDFLVAYFNDLPGSVQLQPGLTLRLPKIEPAAATRAASPEELLNRGRSLFKAKKYDQALRHAEKILEYAPDNSQANDLKNACYYQLATERLRKNEYRESLRMFKKADRTYKNVGERIADLEKRLQVRKTQAENHYQKGVKHFLAEELDKAVREWENTLQLDPQHPKAKKDLDQARRLQERLRKIQ